MYQFGPYGPNHSTAATFAFRRELLGKTRYEDNAALAEEKEFLKGYTIPFVQLDPIKTILVFSHIHNSFDKKQLLVNLESSKGSLSTRTINEFIQDEDTIKFFLNDIDDLLKSYGPGKVENKPEVLKQISEIR
jgi:hypothetical protein